MSQISEYFRSIFFPNLGITLRNIGDHINIGSFEVRFYGIIIMIGFLLAYVLVTNEAKRTKQNPEMYLDFILILIIPAILGARLYYILFRLDQYIVQGDVGATIKAMLNIRGGGLAIYGGIIAGVITAVIFCKVRKVSFVLMADTATFGILIGQILGRFGNFFNREAFGAYTNSKMAMAIPLDYYRSDGNLDYLERTGVITQKMLDNVMNIDGTTRDAVDTEIVRNGREYVFIDTAGLRRKSKIKEDIERYSIIRTVSAVERCNVAVLVIDATEGITDQDAKIAGIAHDRGKGMIIAVNKWDAIEKNDKTIYKFTEEIRNKLSYMPYAELLFISAQTGQRLPKLFETIDAVIENHSLRIATGVLNEIMSEAVAMQQPPSDKGKRLKLYYITQVSVKPPTFVIFVNDKELMHFSYTRYIENRIRESFGFRGTPLKFIIRERKEK